MADIAAPLSPLLLYRHYYSFELFVNPIERKKVITMSIMVFDDDNGIVNLIWPHEKCISVYAALLELNKGNIR